MNKQLLFLALSLLSGCLFAQQKVTFPDDFQTDALNGKEVTISNTLTLTNNFYSFQKSGSVTLSNGMLWIPTEKNAPGADMFAQVNAKNAANQLILEKGAYNYIDADGTCRIGQTITGLTGTATYSSSLGKYTLTPTKKPEFTGNQRPTSAQIEGTYNVKVASFNVEWYKAEDDVQRTKVTAALKAMDADIYALVEICGDAAAEDLCNALNKLCNTTVYKHTLNKNSTDQLNYFIYNSDKVETYKDLQKNALAIWNDKPYLKERKVAQAFNLKKNKERFIICLNHWKAKDNKEDAGDGQGGSVEKRITEANATCSFVKEITTYFEDPDVLVVGDLNSYTQEDPIRILEKGGFINQLQKYAPNEYSYAFNTAGSYAVGYLDHSLATSSLDAQICCAQPFRINADEPKELELGQQPQLDNMYRCSDHNPIITAINLGSTTGIENTTSNNRPAIRLLGDPHSREFTLVAPLELSLIRVEITGISGQVIATYNTHGSGNTFKLPLKGFAHGFYLIRAYDDKGGCTTCKLILS